MIFVSTLGHCLPLIALIAWAGEAIFGKWLGSGRGASLGLASGEISTAVLKRWDPIVWSPIVYTNALLGELGALSWIYLLHLLLRSTRGVKLLGRREARILALAAVAGAILIYPASLGIPGAPDFYEAGFGGFFMPTAAFALAATLLWHGYCRGAVGIAFGLVLYGLNLHESANLWDCLFDVLSVLVSAVILIRWGLESLRRLRQSPDRASLDPSHSS